MSITPPEGTTTSPILCQGQGVKPYNLSVVSSSLQQPPHYSALVGKTLALDKNHNVTVEEVIAEGGFGVIFLVKNSADKTKYALKRVVVNNERDYASVVSEVAIMSSLSHSTPHILQSLSHSIISYSQNFTKEVQNLMPLCKHNMLQFATQKIQRQASFNDGEVLGVLHNVAKGLFYLHSHVPAILHRDVKIENILVMLDDSYVLSDFGSSTTKVWDPNVDPVTAINEDLDKHTTLLYRAPEMVDLYGNRGLLTVSSDIWALGVCAYKLMTFKDPFEGILAIQNRNLSWGSAKNKFTPELVKLVDCLLAEHQTVRPGIDEVIRICAAGTAADWAPLSACAARIAQDAREKNHPDAKKSAAAGQSGGTVVLETSVTPRQRPKRGVAGGGAAGTTPNNVVLPPVIPGPPKSPKPVSPREGAPPPPSGGAVAAAGDERAGKFFSPNPSTQGAAISPSTLPAPSSSSSAASSNNNNKASPSPTTTPLSQQQPQQIVAQPPVASWNPFDEDYNSHCDTDSIHAAAAKKDGDPEHEEDEDDDPFAKAPFDYFKYQPIMVGGGGGGESSSTSEQHQFLQNQYEASNQYNLNYTSDSYSLPQYYAPNNPFLNFPDDGSELTAAATTLAAPQAAAAAYRTSSSASHSGLNNNVSSNSSAVELQLATNRVTNLTFDEHAYAINNNAFRNE